MELSTISSEPAVITSPSAAIAVAWSADGSRIAAASNYGRQITVWDKFGRQLRLIDTQAEGPVLGASIAFGANRSQVVYDPPGNASSDVALAVWDVDSGKIVKLIRGPCTNGAVLPGANRGEIYTSDPKGRYIVSVSQAAREASVTCNGVVVYSTLDWSIVGGLRVKTDPGAVGTFENGRVIIFDSGDGDVTLFDAACIHPPVTFQAYERVKFGTRDVLAVAGSPDGRFFLASAGGGLINGPYVNDPTAIEWGQEPSPLRIFRADNGQLVASFDPPFEIQKARWDPKGRYVAFVDYSQHLFIWRPFASRLGYARFHLPTNGLGLAISPDGNSIATTTDTGVIVLALDDRQN
jgi:WD40 repeat protein